MSASKVAWRQELQILISCLSLNHREEKQPISCQRAVTAYDQKTPKFCLKQKLSWELFISFSIILWSKNLSFAGQNKLISIIIWAQKNKAESNPCAPWVHWYMALRWLVSKCSLIKNKTITQKTLTQTSLMACTTQYHFSTRGFRLVVQQKNQVEVGQVIVEAANLANANQLQLAWWVTGYCHIPANIKHDHC